MCGIVGLFNYQSHREADPGLLRAMCRSIEHRGPDWSDVWAEGEFGFGMVRLSIIGGDEANQPLWTRGGTLGVVFNGEIYNYQELNARHHLDTTSDTRTFLHMYEREGEACLPQLAGMFALAVFNRTHRRLFLARDRFGKKPLFIARTPDGLAFASEIKPLLLVPGVDRDLDRESVSRFLSMGYVAGGFTPYKGVGQIAPSSWLEVGADGELNGSYFQLAQQPEDPGLVDGFEPLFRQAVTRRLVSDVPVGIFLSGGVDSNAILATAMHDAPGAIERAYTIVTPGCPNETATVRRTCSHFGLPLDEVPVTPEYLRDNLPRIVHVADNLLANPPMVALDALSAAAAGKTKVVLSGSGGDEVFFGYPTWKADWFYGYFRHVPRFLRRLGLGVLEMGKPAYGPHALTYAMRQILTCPAHEVETAHAWWRTILAGDELARIAPGLPDLWSVDYANAFARAAGLFDSRVRRTAYADLMVWWRHMGLYQTDVIPMGRGIELRSPFMDHDLVEWSLRIPLDRLYHPLKSKPFLRERLRSMVPEWVLQAPKCPFHIPLGQWMLGPLRDFVCDVLAPQTLGRQGLLDAAGTGRLVQDHMEGRQDNSFKLFSLMVLTLWVDKVMGETHG